MNAEPIAQSAGVLPSDSAILYALSSGVQHDTPTEIQSKGENRSQSYCNRHSILLELCLEEKEANCEAMGLPRQANRYPESEDMANESHDYTHSCL